MVGIIVIGLIGGVIAATVFAVIPWAQNNAAKQQLDSIASAQSAYIGLSVDKGDSRFGGAPVSTTTTAGVTTYAYTKGSTVGADAIVSQTLFSAGSATNVAVGMWGTAQFGGAHYAAAVRSGSGDTFYISDSKTQPTALTPAQQSSSKANSEIEAIAYSVK